MTDLLDARTRAAVADRLGTELWGGRPVLLAPVVLAAVTKYVEWFGALDCRVLALTTSHGVGPVPEPGSFTEVPLTVPATVSLTEELRLHDRLVRDLPPGVREAVEAFDPERRGTWFTTPFVSTDDPVEDRPVTGGRPCRYLRLEDKLRADDVWAAAGVDHAPYRVVALDDDAALEAATADLAGPLGAVWAGDARDGFNGGGNYVRWLGTDCDRVEALAFFRPRCDRVRVMPFLEGVPCSVHGFVLPGGTAALRPVEIVTLRDPGARRLAYAGLGSTWDPPAADREEMRAAVRRVGAHLQREHGYRGAFGIDGVLTADGFRPTELNTRMSAGASVLGELDRRFFTFLQAALVAGVETGLGPADLEALVPAMDAERVARVAAFGEGVAPPPDESHSVTWDGTTLSRSAAETGTVLQVGSTPTGLFAKLDPCAELVPGRRLAPLNAGLLRHLDATYGTSFGPLEPAPEARGAP